MRDNVRILIVEDDESIRDFIEMGLEDEGYQSAVAADGAIALALIPTYRPNIILLDLHMPNMDGRTFVDLYRQTPAPHARIIMLTASRNPTTAAAEIGADGLLAKPFDLDDLYATIKAFLPA
ncbi:MAG TPA: response regulator transcription factor [Herpetosiphonaceae bacterium]